MSEHDSNRASTKRFARYGQLMSSSSLQESNVLPSDVLPTQIIPRRDFLKGATAVLALLVSPIGKAAATSVLAVRVWPAEDYSRVTIESSEPLKFNQFRVANPDRLVVDVEGVELNSILSSLPGKIAETDPYIKLIRAGRNKADTVRLVIELKQDVKPQLFALKPVGEYGHRLVLDLYPAHPPDALMSFLGQRNTNGPRSTRTDTLRMDELRVNRALLEDRSRANEKVAEANAERTLSEKVAERQPEKSAEKVVEKNTDRQVDSTVRVVESNAEKNAERAAEKSSRNGGRRHGQEEAEPQIDRLLTIVLDPGHGGEDPGAVGAGGSREKEVTLQIARRLKARIEAEPNMRVLMTRDSDFFVPLQQRVAKARKVQADLFVSIHADAFISPSARGSSVFVLSEKGATSTAARWLAQRENAADLVGGVNVGKRDANLARTLFDLSQTATINDSMKLGKAVLKELGGINRLHRGEVEQAGFAVLKAPDIPSILVETAFISNPDEEKRLTDEAYQARMAEAILRGIKRYFARNPPLNRSRMASLF